MPVQDSIEIMVASNPLLSRCVKPGSGLNSASVIALTARNQCLTLVLLFAAALATASALYAADPVLNELQPRGGQRGKTFTLTLKGEGLTAGADLITSLPCTVTKLGPPRDAEMPGGELAYLIHLPEDSSAGVYPIRIRTGNGLSNVQIFTVSDLPEISEKEPNDSFAEAQPITFPTAVSGSLKGADEDFFSFTAAARERLVIEVEARRIGSAIDPKIEVYDSAGHTLVENDDAPGLGVDSRIDLTFPKAGKYFVAVRDSKFSEQTENFYRLKIGNFAYADGIFPLGWQRGKPVAVTLFGGNLPQPVVVHPNTNVPEGQDFVAIIIPGSKPLGSIPFQFRISDFPETLAGADGSVTDLQPSTVTNGRILKSGEVDRFKLKVTPAETWMVKLDSAALGTSLLYGSVVPYDSKGKKLEVKDVGWGADPRITFKVPADVHEVTLAVSDVRGQGGPTYTYRLIAQPQDGDWTLKLQTPYVNVPARGTAVIKVVAERQGYIGPIRLSIPNLPNDFIFGGGNIAAELTPSINKREVTTIGYITLTAKPDAKPHTTELVVWGEAGPPEHPVRHRAEGPGLIYTVKGEELLNLTGDSTITKPTTFPWLGIGLPAELGAALPVALEVAKGDLRFVQGMNQSMPFELVKQGAGIVTENVTILALPRVRDLLFKNRTELIGVDKSKVVLGTTQETPLIKFDLVPTASVLINGKRETIVAPATTIELVRAYTVEVKSPRVVLKGNNKAELAGIVHREPAFKATVKISVGDPPDKVACGPAEVPDGTSDFSLTCSATPGAQEGAFEVHLVSTATVPGGEDKTEYTYPPVATQMVVGGDNVAANTGVQAH